MFYLLKDTIRNTIRAIFIFRIFLLEFPYYAIVYLYLCGHCSRSANIINVYFNPWRIQETKNRKRKEK